MQLTWIGRNSALRKRSRAPKTIELSDCDEISDETVESEVLWWIGAIGGGIAGWRFFDAGSTPLAWISVGIAVAGLWTAGIAANFGRGKEQMIPTGATRVSWSPQLAESSSSLLPSLPTGCAFQPTDLVLNACPTSMSATCGADISTAAITRPGRMAPTAWPLPTQRCSDAAKPPSEQGLSDLARPGGLEPPTS